MSKYWMINDRDNNGTGTGPNLNGLTYWVSDGGDLSEIDNWTKVEFKDFKRALISATDDFPLIDHAQHHLQNHVSMFIHGYNTDFDSAAKLYQNFHKKLFNDLDFNGICILYDWPSLGSLLGYLPDRSHARKCAEDLTNVLCELYDWLLIKQTEGAENSKRACRAKVSVISHSMGNYLLQKAMVNAWSRKNQPLLVSLINQLIMVGADVDNDLFDTGSPDNTDGQAIANFTYRVTALFSGRDDVLGASAGLKHFGTRRLGRSGLSHRPPAAAGANCVDNVWDIDCSSFFPNASNGINVHSDYFNNDEIINLMRQILIGVDRTVLEKSGIIRGSEIV